MNYFQMTKILVSGSATGLGSFFKRKLKADIYNRYDDNKHVQNRQYDLILHTAFGRYTNDKNPEVYIKEAMILTKLLSNLSCKKFIFISTIDCFSSKQTPYTTAKLECEKIVKKIPRSLTIRLPSLYGPNMKKNQIFKIATEFRPILTLKHNSTFSLLSYQQVLKFILTTKSYGLKTIMSSVVTLSEIANIFGCNPIWGNYEYFTPSVENSIILEPRLMLDQYKNFVCSGDLK